MTRSTLLTTRPARPLIAASILSADFAHLADECRAVLSAGADLLHLDVMDGHFVPNLTMGPNLCRSLRRALPDAHLDVHLMVTDPQQMIEPFADAGADHLTFHIEANGDAESLVRSIHDCGMTAGVSVRPPTPAEALDNVIEHVDLVLLMTVHPGFAGQSFMADMMPKARQIKAKLRDNQRLEVDGGVNPDTAEQCRDAGCDVLVAASAIFGSRDYASAIASIRGGSHVPSGS